MEKAHIIREIKRTAATNGGVPLGWRRFLSETGIRQADWFGIHWPRSSDALREAGFTPNQLIEGYDESELLESFASLAKELNRLPTDADLRFKARQQPGFPSTKPLRRLGTKADLIAKLAGYCRSVGGYDDVIRMCEEYAPRTRPVADEPAEAGTVMGYVYLIRMGTYYKIGMTNCIGRREYELNLQLPERTELVHVIATDDPAGIEAYWHQRFAPKNTNGEWFALDAADVVAFKRRKFM